MNEALQTTRDFSYLLSEILDDLGYHPEMINTRIRYYRKMGAIIQTMAPSFQFIISGSKGEGLTKPYESDLDALSISDMFSVCDKMNNTAAYSTIDTNYEYVGYVLFKQNELSSNIFRSVQTLLSQLYSRTRLSMPGAALVNRNAVELPTDMVPSRKYRRPVALHIWGKRVRLYDWPKLSLRKIILKMDGNLVAKGHRNSQKKDIEWRICFNEIELLLSESLNDTQKKLSVLLKMIIKEFVNTEDINISSYIAKNVVFWMAENHPQSWFTHASLFFWIKTCLRFIIRCVDVYFLPYYMIPGRNLLAENTELWIMPVLRSRLSDILESNMCRVQELRKFRQVEHLTHHELRLLAESCNRFEKMYYRYQGEVSVELFATDENQKRVARKKRAIALQILENMTNKSDLWPKDLYEKHIKGRHFLSEEVTKVLLG